MSKFSFQLPASAQSTEWIKRISARLQVDGDPNLITDSVQRQKKPMVQIAVWAFAAGEHPS